MENNEIKSGTEKQKSRLFSWGNLGILFSGFGTVVLIIVMGIAMYSTLILNGKLAQSIEFLCQRMTTTENTLAETQQNFSKLQSTTEEMQGIIKNQNQAIVDLQKMQHPNKSDFLTTDAYSLVKLASYHLQYEKNTALAIKLLQEADQEIAKINNAATYSVRAALASDLAALQHAPELDVAGIYLRLSAVGEQLDKLPLKNISHFLKTEPREEGQEKVLSWWQRGINALLEALRRIVVIHHNQADVPPFITPEQQLFLYQNLHAEIDQAKWGLLHRQPVVYRESLQQIENWVRQYAAADAATTRQSLLDLQQLKQMTVDPPLPTVMKSLNAFQAYTSKGE